MTRHITNLDLLLCDVIPHGFLLEIQESDGCESAEIVADSNFILIKDNVANAHRERPPKSNKYIDCFKLRSVGPNSLLRCFEYTLRHK